jgi:hypothetical protein
MQDTERRQKSLQADRIYETISRLGKRIRERFPDSSLASLCEELRDVSEDAKNRSEQISRPLIGLRIGLGVLVAAIVLGVIGAVVSLERTTQDPSLAVFVQLLEAGINDVVLIGAAIFFLMTFETRIKRNRALNAIHELRSFAHIIDMHQLTKDVTRMQGTASSPARVMTAVELERYLDYCTEMLSLVGKVAALYIQHFDDQGAVAAVNEVENLTTGLSRKIWQKITLIESHAQRVRLQEEAAETEANRKAIADAVAESDLPVPGATNTSESAAAPPESSQAVVPEEPAEVEAKAPELDAPTASVEPASAEALLPEDSVAKVEDSVAEVEDSVAEVEDSVAEVEDSVAEVEDSVAEVEDSVAAELAPEPSEAPGPAEQDKPPAAPKTAD